MANFNNAKSQLLLQQSYIYIYIYTHTHIYVYIQSVLEKDQKGTPAKEITIACFSW